MAMIMRISDATRVIGKAQGYIGLPLKDELVKIPHELIGIRDALMPDGATGVDVNAMHSAWELTPEELEKLRQGAPLILRVLGINHPPVMIFVGEVPKG